MRLVEIVKGLKTSDRCIEQLIQFVRNLSKEPVVCRDTPGFLVNRIARPFYNEALKIMGEGIADVAQIDRLLKEAGQFRMGPFELQDLIGIDVNFATTLSVHGDFFGEPRFRPHPYQERMVHSGQLGRKTGVVIIVTRRERYVVILGDHPLSDEWRTLCRQTEQIYAEKLDSFLKQGIHPDVIIETTNHDLEKKRKDLLQLRPLIGDDIVDFNVGAGRFSPRKWLPGWRKRDSTKWWGMPRFILSPSGT